MTSKQEESTKTTTNKQGPSSSLSLSQPSPKAIIADSIILPSSLEKIFNVKKIQNALEALDIEFVGNGGGDGDDSSDDDNDDQDDKRIQLQLISDDDLFGYSRGKDHPKYQQLYTIFSTGSGANFHIWRIPQNDNNDNGDEINATSLSSSADTNMDDDSSPIVYLGSEGERAKIALAVVDFLHIAASLAPYLLDVISDLPGINTSPDNGNILEAAIEDFDFIEITSKLKLWMSSSSELGSGGIEPEIIQASKDILETINKPKLTIHEALEKLIQSHLSEPRFAIESSEDDNNVDVNDGDEAGDEKEADEHDDDDDDAEEEEKEEEDMDDVLDELEDENDVDDDEEDFDDDDD